MYHVKPFIDVMFKMASDPELDLDMLRLVHAEHDMTFHKTMQTELLPSRHLHKNLPCLKYNIYDVTKILVTL